MSAGTATPHVFEDEGDECLACSPSCQGCLPEDCVCCEDACALCGCGEERDADADDDDGDEECPGCGCSCSGCECAEGEDCPDCGCNLIRCEDCGCTCEDCDCAREYCSCCGQEPDAGSTESDHTAPDEPAAVTLTGSPAPPTAAPAGNTEPAAEPSPGEIREDGTCPRCYSAWGENLVCRYCTDGDGNPMPTRWDSPKATQVLIREDARGRFYRRNDDGSASIKKSLEAPWTRTTAPYPSTATPVTAERAATLGRESGRCLACNRSLNASSAATGYGPKCRSRFV